MEFSPAATAVAKHQYLDQTFQFPFERFPPDLSSQPPARRLQNHIFEKIRVNFRAFERLKCIRMHPKWTVNSIPALQTVRKQLKSSF